MKTDLAIYPQPPLAIPLLGKKVIDPVFGTEILRATDESDGTNIGTFYSYWPTLNINSTRLLIKADGGQAFLRKFDSVNFTLGAKELLAPIPGVGNPMFEGATWSSDPDILLITANAALYAFHADMKVYELLADLGSLIPGEFIKQPSWSRDGKRIGFSRKRFADYVEPGYAVYDLTLKKLVLKVDSASFDELTISQSGRYVLAKNANAPGAGVVESTVHDLVTGTAVELIDDVDAAPGHGDAGWDSYVGYDNHKNRITWRSLLNPKSFKTLLQFEQWGHGVGHASMRAVDETWVLHDFSGVTDQRVFANEIIQLATDGSGRVRRLLHHRSIEAGYYTQPRANISSDGRFVAFTSNWGSALRTDLFIARIDADSPPPPPIDPPPPPIEPTKPPTVSAPESVTIPRNSTGSISVTLSNLTAPVAVTAQGSDGQVTVSPLSKTANPTSSILAFQVKVKKQPRTITFQTPFGSVKVRVNVS